MKYKALNAIVSFWVLEIALVISWRVAAYVVFSSDIILKWFNMIFIVVCRKFFLTREYLTAVLTSASICRFLICAPIVLQSGLLSGFMLCVLYPFLASFFLTWLRMLCMTLLFTVYKICMKRGFLLTNKVFLHGISRSIIQNHLNVYFFSRLQSHYQFLQ
jgi:hypothetical protein